MVVLSTHSLSTRRPPPLFTITLCNQFLWTLGGGGLTVGPLVFQSMNHRKCGTNRLPTRGPGKANFCFEFFLKCLKRESNLSSLVCQASMLTIRSWMAGWVGLMRACGAVATCVWSAYGLPPSHFDCLRWEGIQLTHMNGVRASALVF